MASKYIVTIDLGGTNVLSALIDDISKIVDRVKIPTEISENTDSIVEPIVDSVKGLIKKNKIAESSIRAIAMGVPGTVNPHTGIIGSAPNLKIKNFNIKKAIQKRFKIPVLIENDVNLAALGIKKFEFSEKTNNMLVVFVGTGIGGALIIDHKIYRGSGFFAGEIGHMKVTANGSLSGGKKNLTFENIASRTAIVDAIKKDLKKHPESVLSEMEKKRIKSKALANAVAKGDKYVIGHIESACKVIGTVLGSINTLLNFDTIVLGGGVIEAMGDFMMPLISKAFYKSVLEEPGKQVTLLSTKLGDDAPLLGGVALTEEFSK